MKQELYKMYRKKYFISLFLLLILPFLFGAGTFFHLPYMTSGDISASALDYCAEMQELVKFFYFLIAVYLASDFFAGEREDGQLCMGILYTCNRRKFLCGKIAAYSVLMFIFQLIFWVFNMAMYFICTIKEAGPVLLHSRVIKAYLEMFSGYLEAAVLYGTIAILAGLFFKKIHTVILVYFTWLGFRYINELAGLKQILPEFYADFLLEHGIPSGRGIPEMSFIVGAIIIIVIVFSALHIFERKDIAS